MGWDDLRWFWILHGKWYLAQVIRMQVFYLLTLEDQHGKINKHWYGCDHYLLWQVVSHLLIRQQDGFDLFWWMNLTHCHWMIGWMWSLPSMESCISYVDRQDGRGPFLVSCISHIITRERVVYWAPLWCKRILILDLRVFNKDEKRQRLIWWWWDIWDGTYDVVRKFSLAKREC